MVKSGTCATEFSGVAQLNVSGALPIRFESFKATKEISVIRIQWTAYAEQNTFQYKLEKSTDGIHFSTLRKITPFENKDIENEYSTLDLSPVKGMNYYRIRELMNNGSAVVSAIIKISWNEVKRNISAYPNPVSDVTTIQIEGKELSGTIAILSNNYGSVVRKIKISNSLEQINMKGLPAGLYLLRFENGAVLRLIKD